MPAAPIPVRLLISGDGLADSRTLPEISSPLVEVAKPVHWVSRLLRLALAEDHGDAFSGRLSKNSRDGKRG